MAKKTSVKQGKVERMVRLPFDDCKGTPIYEGSIIEQQCFNGHEYRAEWLVIRDPHGGSKETGGLCLKIIEGSGKHMAGELLAFPSQKDGRLRKGYVVPNTKADRCEEKGE